MMIITVITSKRRLLSLNLKELWKYRDLVFLFVKRDLKSSYKQTILGPLWLVINPFISSFVFTLIFGIIANISTDGIPQFVFYMSGEYTVGTVFRAVLHVAHQHFCQMPVCSARFIFLALPHRLRKFFITT